MQSSKQRLVHAAAIVVLGLAATACAPADNTGTQQGAAPIYPGESPGAVPGPEESTNPNSSTSPVIVPGSPTSEQGVF